ncbi:MAG: hypothetical protein M3T56_03845 [Chloroflexota bacterium]|nr:hypothetical protein [Chloroflexota bacterium]
MGDFAAVGALVYLILSLVPICAVIWSERKGLARPLTFLVAMTVIYYVVPMALAFTDGTASLSVVPVVLVATANLLFLAAHQSLPAIDHRTHALRLSVERTLARLHLGLPGTPATPLLALCLVIGLFSAAAFFSAVGGLGYLCHLNLTGAVTAGKTYLLWGMLLPKSAALALSPSRKQLGVTAPLFVVYAAIALLLVVLTGSRIFLLIGMIQAALIFHFAFRRLRTIEIVGFLVLLLGVAVLYGEYRIESSTSACAGISVPPTAIDLPGFQPAGSTSTAPTGLAPGESFTDRLRAKLTNPQYLRDRYTANFVDSLYVFRRLYAVVPSETDYLHGASFARLLLQPIPRSLRPELPPLPTALTAEFTSPEGGNVFQLWAEAYLNFGSIGVGVIAMLAGFALAAATRRVDAVRETSRRAVLIALLVTSMLLLYRGSFIGATSVALMDLIPVLIFFAVTRSAHGDRQLKSP